MLAFGRLANFVLQKSGKAYILAAREHQEAGNVKVLLGVIGDLKVKITTRVDALVDIKADALVEAQAEISALVADIELCSNAIASLKNLNVDAKLKTSIAAHVLVIVRAILKICASLTAKFGIQVFLELFAQLDLCLKVLLRALDVCMGGFLVVLGKLLVEADLKALVEAKLIVCHDLFVLIRAAIGIIAGANVAL